MKILRSSSELVSWRQSVESSRLVGFVPTMGALHDGHLSLVCRCLEETDITVVSIFVNPKQFGENEDLDLYPRNMDADLEKLKTKNVDVVFAPGVSDIYGDDDTLVVEETSLSLKLEGKSRSHFFSGVLTVVSKLFNLVAPSRAYFGQKDAQQLVLIEKLVSDMKYPISIVGCPTIREENGLAMSSRNEYLTVQERSDAKIIYQSLIVAKKLLSNNEMDAGIIKEAIIETLGIEQSIRIEYVSITNIGFLDDIGVCVPGNTLISLAVFLRDVRLIDNIIY